jgi:hypothetical protein
VNVISDVTGGTYQPSKPRRLHFTIRGSEARSRANCKCCRGVNRNGQGDSPIIGI